MTRQVGLWVGVVLLAVLVRMAIIEHGAMQASLRRLERVASAQEAWWAAHQPVPERQKWTKPRWGQR